MKKGVDSFDEIPVNVVMMSKCPGYSAVNILSVENSWGHLKTRVIFQCFFPLLRGDILMRECPIESSPNAGIIFVVLVSRIPLA